MQEILWVCSGDIDGFERVRRPLSTNVWFRNPVCFSVWMCFSVAPAVNIIDFLISCSLLSRIKVFQCGAFSTIINVQS
jgi:hypothetical protein